MGTMKRTFSSPALWGPLITFAVMAAFSFWYYYTALQSCELALDDQTFRSLGLFADQFRDSLSALQELAERATGESDLLSLHPDFEREECFPHQHENSLGVVATNAVPEKFFSFSYRKAILTGKEKPSPPICFKQPVNRFLQPFEESFQWNIVKDIFFANTSGEVIYQSSRSNVTLTNLRSFYLDDVSGRTSSDSTSKSPSSPTQQISDSSRQQSKATQTKLNGVLQELQISSALRRIRWRGRILLRSRRSPT